MIGRGVELLKALAGGKAPPNAQAIAVRLLSTGKPPAELADAIVRALALPAVAQKNRTGMSTWILMTTTSAVLAAVFATHASFAMSSLLEQTLFPGAFLLPLGALPFAALGLWQWRRVRWTEREEAACAIAGELRRLRIDPGSAYAAGCFIASHQGSVVVNVARPATATVFPALAASWAVFAFWGLYFWTIGAVSW